MKRAITKIRINPITPEYVPMPEKPQTARGIDEYILSRANAKKANVTSYYHALVQSIRTGYDFKGEELEINHPLDYGVNENGFSPDILKLYETGPEYIEVKSAQYKRGEIFCAKMQLLNYYKLLIERLNWGDEFPSVNYVIARYGTGNDYELHHCKRHGKKQRRGIHHCDNKCLTMNLTQKRLQLSIIPFNLLLGFFASGMFHRMKSMNHTSSTTGRNTEYYIHLQAKLFSNLHGHLRKIPIQSLDELFQDSIDQELRDLLMIDSLTIKGEQSPKEFSCAPIGSIKQYPISPFSIVRFEMPQDAEKQWLDNFCRLNGDLIYRCVGEIQEEFQEEF